jgi:polysaccharide chain length determinant protein (PEP-CTERM system associated)
MNVDEGFQLRDVAGLIRRRLVPASAVAGLTFLASVVLAALLPNRYEAWTTLLVSPQTVSKKLVEPGFEESELNQRLHLMTMQILSRGRLSRIIDDLGLYPEESKAYTREEVIEFMRDDIRVEPVYPELEGGRRRTTDQEVNTFRLYYQSHQPDIAAAVAQRLANDFIDEHIRERVEVSTGTSEFIEAELQRLSSEIGQVEQRIAAVKNENTGSLPEDVDANQRLLERAISDLRFAQRDLSIAESDAAFYRQQALTGASDRARSFADPDTPAERLQRLEIALGEGRAKGWTDKHPDIIQLQEEIAALKERRGDMDMEESEEPKVSTDQQLAANEAQRAELRAQSARQEIERLDNQVDDIQARLAKTPQVAEQLVGLEREHEHLYQSFQEFSAKRLEAGVSANMERRQKGEQFRILEAAFPPPDHSSPNRRLILILGLFLGMCLGVGAAVLLEVADTSVHGPRELQAAFRLPVLAAIPRVLLESDRARIRRRRFAAGALAASVTLVTLVGAGAGYWIVNGGAGGASGSEPAAPAETAPAQTAPADQAGEQG